MMWPVRDRIEAARMKRMTAREALQRKPTAAHKTKAPERFVRIVRATRIKAASRA
jgi:hypothetical protein